MTVKKDTRVTVRLLNAIGSSEMADLQVAPKRSALLKRGASEPIGFDDDDPSGNEDDPEVEAAPAKRRKTSATWTFCGALRPSSGQTAHSVQGSTFGPDERCVVDLAGFPRSISGYHMLIVALSRVRRVENLYVLNYDPDMIATLASACGCGCVKSGPHVRSHSDARLASYEAHLAALAQHNRAAYSPDNK